MLEKKIAKYYDPMFVNKKNNKEMHKYVPGTKNMFPICLAHAGKWGNLA